ncbi:MAG: SPFH domain-containing protein [Gammaproteobacteria bacterium]|nr:SPFH domain-containing protein [Gammaproteobacteria bacterium]MCP5459957.1 SPFH domain-containing protein [Gammaproteobacteria bacterium]
MSLWGKITGEFIDVIEWTDDSNDTLVYRFERYGNEIKYGAKLTVRQAQMAVFVNEGQIADVFVPGMYTLETKNVPILSTLQGWKYGFQSPFKAEVYFVNTRQFTDYKWGTKNPVIVRDPEFQMVRLRAFGTYAFRVTDAAAFIKEVVGTDGHFTTEEIAEQLRNIIVSRFSNSIAQAKIPVLDLAANYTELGQFITNTIAPEFEAYGLSLTKLLVENISLPPEVEAAMDKRSSMGIVGNLHQYTQFQAAEALRAAAENPGAAGGSMGLGMGFVMAQQMGQTLAGASQPAGDSAPPPMPAATAQYFAHVNQQQAGPFAKEALSKLVEGGQLTRDTLIWKQGMATWQAAGEIDELQDLFPQAPPPLPGGDVTYFLSINGKQAGPFMMEALQKQIQGGQLTAATLVWKPGMAKWQAAQEVEELSLLLNSLPPPLPPEQPPLPPQ